METGALRGNGILEAWQKLGLKQRLAAIAAVSGVVVVMGLMAMMAGREGEALLMSGLEPDAAGEIVSALDAMGVPYTVKGTGVFVPQSQRDRLRLALAKDGLPSGGLAGYELLDELNGFSTTSDMFDAAYWRAKEGELARTIRSIPAVTAARVHLGIARGNAFRRDQAQKTASVSIETTRPLSEEQARSIQTLTALAVAGLSPDQVAVIDGARGVIAGPGKAGNAGQSMMAEDKAAAVEQRLTRLLEARVGPGKAVVSVALEIERQAVSETQRVVDPDRLIAQRRSSEERDVEAAGAGAVTVASNLPDGDVEGEGEETAVLRTSRNEDVVFTGTELERRTDIPPGAVKRLSVAVLLDEATRVTDTGDIVSEPRGQDEIDALRDLVASAAGINEERGDTLTLRTMSFGGTPAIEGTPAPGLVESTLMPRLPELLKIALFGIVALALGLFVVKPLLTAGPEDEIAEPNALPKDAASLLTVLVEENPDDAAAVLDAWFEEDTAKVV